MKILFKVMMVHAMPLLVLKHLVLRKEVIRRKMNLLKEFVGMLKKVLRNPMLSKAMIVIHETRSNVRVA